MKKIIDYISAAIFLTFFLGLCIIEKNWRKIGLSLLGSTFILVFVGGTITFTAKMIPVVAPLFAWVSPIAFQIFLCWAVIALLIYIALGK